MMFTIGVVRGGGDSKIWDIIGACWEQPGGEG